MVSFDVTSLYTIIPRADTLNGIIWRHVLVHIIPRADTLNIIKIMLIMIINLLVKQLYLKTSFLI